MSSSTVNVVASSLGPLLTASSHHQPTYQGHNSPQQQQNQYQTSLPYSNVVAMMNIEKFVHDNGADVRHQKLLQNIVKILKINDLLEEYRTAIRKLRINCNCKKAKVIWDKVNSLEGRYADLILESCRTSNATSTVVPVETTGARNITTTSGNGGNGASFVGNENATSAAATVAALASSISAVNLKNVTAAAAAAVAVASGSSPPAAHSNHQNHHHHAYSHHKSSNGTKVISPHATLNTTLVTSATPTAPTKSLSKHNNLHPNTSPVIGSASFGSHSTVNNHQCHPESEPNVLNFSIFNQTLGGGISATAASTGGDSVGKAGLNAGMENNGNCGREKQQSKQQHLSLGESGECQVDVKPSKKQLSNSKLTNDRDGMSERSVAITHIKDGCTTDNIISGANHDQQSRVVASGNNKNNTHINTIEVVVDPVDTAAAHHALDLNQDDILIEEEDILDDEDEDDAEEELDIEEYMALSEILEKEAKKFKREEDPKNEYILAIRDITTKEIICFECTVGGNCGFLSRERTRMLLHLAKHFTNSTDLDDNEPMDMYEEEDSNLTCGGGRNKDVDISIIPLGIPGGKKSSSGHHHNSGKSSGGHHHSKLHKGSRSSKQQQNQHLLMLQAQQAAAAAAQFQLGLSGGPGSSNGADKPIRCEWDNCNFQCDQNYKLRTHIRQVHEKVRPYLCDWPGCYGAYKTRSNLASHRMVHTGERPFICDFPKCGAKFARKYDCERHRRIHSEKMYACEWPGCGKRLCDPYNLERHMMVHKGELPFRCPIGKCTRGFRELRYLRDHMVNTHKFLPDTNQLRFACLNSAKVSSISGYNLNESSDEGSMPGGNGSGGGGGGGGGGGSSSVTDMSAFVNAIVSAAAATAAPSHAGTSSAHNSSGGTNSGEGSDSPIIKAKEKESSAKVSQVKEQQQQQSRSSKRNTTAGERNSDRNNERATAISHKEDKQDDRRRSQHQSKSSEPPVSVGVQEQPSTDRNNNLRSASKNKRAKAPPQQPIQNKEEEETENVIVTRRSKRFRAK